MTNRTNRTKGLIPKHGGYRKLKSYQMATIIYDLTAEFCRQYIKSRRTREQMEQAARSGKQNIAEGSLASGTSKKGELKLVNVARGSLEELLLDYEDFLRQKRLPLWSKDSSEARQVRALANKTYRSYTTYKSYLAQPETAANCLICLIHQTNYLLDRQLDALEQHFLEEGGFTEKLFRERKKSRGF